MAKKATYKSAQKSPAKVGAKRGVKPAKLAAAAKKAIAAGKSALLGAKKKPSAPAKKAAPKKPTKAAKPAPKAAAKSAVSAKPAKGATKAAQKNPVPLKKAAAPAPVKGAKGNGKGASAADPAPVAVAVAKKGRGKNNPGAAAVVAGRVAVSLRGAAVEVEAVCREVACEGLSTSAGYCRMHYIKNWKKIKRKELILKEGKLNQYIEELVAKYPDKYIEAIRQDLTNDKEFAKVIYDLDLDESVDEFTESEGGENLEAVIDTIKRDFEDEGEGGF